MVAKPLCPLYKYIIKPLDRAYYPELRYAMHSGTMLNAMQKILLRFHHIPSEDLAKMVLANKKKSGLLHFEELEKMAQEIAEELLMDLMKFTMGV